MALGYDNTEFRRNAYLKQMLSVLYRDQFFFGPESPFEVVPPESCPSGNRITLGVEYDTTSNGGTYSYDAAAPSSDDVSQTTAYWTKDPYQAASRLYGVIEDQFAQGAEIPLNRRMKALENTAKNLRAAMVTQMWTDLESDIDSSGNYSDASLTRATYNLASVENTDGGLLGQSHLEDVFEQLEDGDGTGDPAIDTSECIVALGRNQLTHLATSATGNAGDDIREALFNFTARSDEKGPIDPDRIHRVRTWGGAQILLAHGLTNTTVLVLHVPSIRVYQWRPFRATPKSVMADQEYTLLTGGGNAICENPVACAKISGLTA